MLRLRIVTVGKMRNALLEPAIEQYMKRLRPYCKLTWDVIPTSNKDHESKQIIIRTRQAYMVLLDEGGTTLSSSDLAARIQHWQLKAGGEVVVVIGGAYGVSEQVIQRANEVVALSKLTFPHQLVRLVLAEQLYRGFSILAGSNYHHE